MTLTIYADVEITRRKRFHLIHDAEGKLIWSGRHFSDAINWLYHNDARAVDLETEDSLYRITFERLASTRR